jgi:hypothetical protein
VIDTWMDGRKEKRKVGRQEGRNIISLIFGN